MSRCSSHWGNVIGTTTPGTTWTKSQPGPGADIPLALVRRDPVAFYVQHANRLKWAFQM